MGAVRVVDDDIAGQVQSLEDMDGLTGMTINMENVPRSELPDIETSQGFAETIDRILLDQSQPCIIPDSLPPVHLATPNNTSTLSFSSVLKASLRMRSSLTKGEFKRPTPHSALNARRNGASTAVRESPSISLTREIQLLQDISSTMFEDDEDPTQKHSSQLQESKTAPPPLALFDLSGSLPPTNQLIQHMNRQVQNLGRFSDSAYSFQTGPIDGSSDSHRNSLLVPATQFGEPVDISKLLPTTPTLPPTNVLNTAEVSLPSDASTVEVPPTQYIQAPISPECRIGQMKSSSTANMSQIDIFALQPSATQTDLSVPGTMSLTEPSEPSSTTAIVSTPSLPKPSLPLLPEAVEEDEYEHEPFSGHETVVLPDSFDEDDNPFTLPREAFKEQPHSEISEPPALPSQVNVRISEPPVLPSQLYSDIRISEPPLIPSQLLSEHRISEPPVLPSQAPLSTDEPTLDLEENHQATTAVQAYSSQPCQENVAPIDNAPQTEDDEEHEPLLVPRTGKKVRFAPTPVDSSQPPPPTVIQRYRQRTDTQEMEEAFTTSLGRLCQQLVSVPRQEVQPEVKDVDERIMTEGEIGLRPKTPLKIVSRSVTPAKATANGPVASTSKTLSRIIQAISTPKKLSGSAISSPSVQRIIAPKVPSSKSVKSTPRVAPLPIIIANTCVRSTPIKQASATPMLMSKVIADVPPSTAPFKRERSASLLASAKKAKLSDTGKSRLSKVTEGFSEVDHSMTLKEGLLVWAHWRPQYYTAGRIEGKKSKSRDIWQIRPLHRTGSLIDCSVEQLLPITCLYPNDPVLHMLDRRKYKHQRKSFQKIVKSGEGDDELKLVAEDGEMVPLNEAVIDRNMFSLRHREWKARQSEEPEMELKEDEPANVPCDHEFGDEPRYSLTGRGEEVLSQAIPLVFNGLSFVLTGVTDKIKLSGLMEEHGGRVLEEFTDQADSTILIAGGDASSNKTAKYYCAIILGVERLKPSWVEACIAASKLVPKPAHRFDSLGGRKKCPTPCRSLFTDIHIAFIGSKSYKESCEQVAQLTRATIVDPRRLSGMKDRSVVVVLEASGVLKPRLQATCLSNGHLIVEKNWFTDSILQGRNFPIP